MGGANLGGAKGIKLPILNIAGSAHSVFYIDKIIHIGCEKHSIDEWLEKYESIGKENNYTDEQIAEYYTYIKMISNLIKEGEK